MANKRKKVLTEAEQVQLLVDSVRQDFEYEFCPEPTYRFNIGDAVKIGALKDAVIHSVYDDGKFYVIDFTAVDNNYGRPIVTPHMKRSFFWYEIRPINTDEESFIRNKDVSLSFINSTVEGLITKVLHFGVDFDPEYQRDFVWNDSDRIALLDSIFNNIEIGKFAFVHLEYPSKYSYQIIDGKQRLTTLVDFYLNKFPYRGKYFNDLSYADRRWFYGFHVSVAEVREASREQILRYFIMLNTAGHVVSKDHLEKVVGML